MIRISAIGTFTDAEPGRRNPARSSFIDLFNKHGFRTVRIMDLCGDSIHDYPDMVRALKAVSHGHLFHALLSVDSIRSEVVRNGLNLASPDARETLPPSSRKRWRNGCPPPRRRSPSRKNGERQPAVPPTTPGPEEDA